MLKKLLILTGSLSSLSAQMITSTHVPPLELVQNSMAGYGIQVQNVTMQGDTTAYGPFTGTGSTFGFNDGIVLTTGTALWGNGPVGPNNRPDAGVDNYTTGYFLLNYVPTPSVSTYNATVLEIYFKPSGDSIFFTYAFGSEEYKEYVGAQTADIFAAFLTGVIPGGGFYSDQVIATVNINSINHLTNSSLYVDNQDPVPGAFTQYDGHTVALTARAAVIPDTNYILKIAIADVGDGIYDSGLFIKAQSFTSGDYIGIAEEKTNSFVIYPNPADDFILIQSNHNELIENISIMDLTGKMIKREMFQTAQGKLNTEELNPGLYIISISTKSGVFSQKLIVQ